MRWGCWVWKGAASTQRGWASWRGWCQGWWCGMGRRPAEEPLAALHHRDGSNILQLDGLALCMASQPSRVRSASMSLSKSPGLPRRLRSDDVRRP
ncbi:hypothetical protein FA95DRAFT_805195 [Auriscalpium vulgare]|uniref:Uncharacterized protein n=1 Tax=Auriscalpium vulgare TaxID=40419 RepID=A0ACB8RAG2_9AGAM|nr:hypothetical protein FA95DRAFT_805195 [Auriscalpium vulgare]